MIFSTLTAISPVDGRYRNKAENLAAYFSEYALIKYRVQVEIEYFITLSEFLPQLNALATVENKEALRKIYQEFSVEDATRIKEIESVTNHDVKAVEYFIKEKFDLLSLQDYKEFIHFGLTSQDINNTSVPLSIKEALSEVYFPGLEEVVSVLKQYADAWAEIPMLAKTAWTTGFPDSSG
jgi:adenylosuccinate lyase